MDDRPESTLWSRQIRWPSEMRSPGPRAAVLTRSVLIVAASVLAVAASCSTGSGSSGVVDSTEQTVEERGQLRPGQVSGPGYPLPDLELPRHDGSRLSLADLRGRPSVINMFGSWCAPCIREMPDIEEAHLELGDRVAFLGIAVSDTVSAEKDLVENTGITYDVVRDPDGDAMMKLGVLIMPSTIFVNSDGIVVHTHPGVLDNVEVAEILEERDLL